MGVTAGASAPEILVQGVIAQLKNWGGAVVDELKGREEHVIFALPKTLREVTKRVASLSSDGSRGLECRPLSSCNAAIAQLVEQRIRNAWVRGSNPLCGTIISGI